MYNLIIINNNYYYYTFPMERFANSRSGTACMMMINVNELKLIKEFHGTYHSCIKQVNYFKSFLLPVRIPRQCAYLLKLPQRNMLQAWGFTSQIMIFLISFYLYLIFLAFTTTYFVYKLCYYHIYMYRAVEKRKLWRKCS